MEDVEDSPPIPLCTEDNKRYVCLRCVEQRMEHPHVIVAKVTWTGVVYRGRTSLERGTCHGDYGHRYQPIIYDTEE